MCFHHVAPQYTIHVRVGSDSVCRCLRTSGYHWSAIDERWKFVRVGAVWLIATHLCGSWITCCVVIVALTFYLAVGCGLSVYTLDNKRVIVILRCCCILDHVFLLVACCCDVLSLYCVSASTSAAVNKPVFAAQRERYRLALLYGA